MYKMIVVDDEYLVRKGIKETIDWHMHGINVVKTVEHGKEALDIVDQESIDIVLTDIRMPVMDGLDLIRILNERDEDCVVVVLSGYKDFEYAKAALENGALSYLLKPIDNTELVEKVNAAAAELEKRRRRRAFERIIAEDMSKLKRGFLIDMLDGRLADIARFREKATHYDLPLIEEGLVAGIVQEIGDDEADFSSFLCVLSDRLQEKGIAHIFVLYEPSVLAVLQAETAEEMLMPLYEHALRNHEELAEAPPLSIGFSAPFGSMENIPSAFAEALGRAKGKPFPRISAIMGKNDDTIPKGRIRDCLTYIGDNYHRSITVKTVAEALYVSESYLMHLFKDTLGMTFNEYLTDYRLTKAKRLLRQGDKHIYQVASEVGYGDVKYFSQVFKRHVGMTPSEFAWKAREQS